MPRSRSSSKNDSNVTATASSAFNDMASRCLCYRARRTARLISRDYDAALAPTGLKATQLTLLVAIELGDEHGMGELAELLGLEPSTFSRNIAVLKERGLIRIAAGQDKRQRSLTLTSKGRSLVEKAYPLWQAVQLETEQRYLAGDAGTSRRTLGRELLARAR